MNESVGFLRSLYASSPFKGKAFRHGVLVILLILLAIIVHFIALLRAENLMGDLKPDLLPASDSALIRNFKQYDSSWKNGVTQQQVHRLTEQLEEIDHRIQFHFDAVQIFYRNEFSFMITTTLFGILTAIGLFYSLFVGIKNTNEYWRTAFVTTFAIFTLFFSFISIFNIDKNIQDNNAFLQYYISLKDFVLSYKTSHDTVKSDSTVLRGFNTIGFASTSFQIDTLPPDYMIHYIDLNLAKNINVSVAFNVRGIPTPKDIYQNMQNFGK